MRSLLFSFAAVSLSWLALPVSVAGEPASDTRTLTVTAAFNNRTALRVSTQMLQFDIADPAEGSIAIVDFSAAARTRTGDEVVLTVEPLAAVDGPGGAADVETSLTFAGEGNGALSGALTGDRPAVAGRWQGSGSRTGRLIFTLRGAVPGRYVLPVRFLLTTP